VEREQVVVLGQVLVLELEVVLEQAMALALEVVSEHDSFFLALVAVVQLPVSASRLVPYSLSPVVL
jgi:hypothetical protein